MNQTKSMNDEQLKEKYYQYLEEDNVPVPEEVRQAQKRFSRALDDYISLIAEDCFINGYRYAMTEQQEGDAE